LWTAGAAETLVMGAAADAMGEAWFIGRSIRDRMVRCDSCAVLRYGALVPPYSAALR
jgi:hypothetical protein